MIYSWMDEGNIGAAADRVHVCRVNDRKIGRLHYYEGVGYFAYLLDERLNRSPIKSLVEAMTLVHTSYQQRVEHRLSA